MGWLDDRVALITGGASGIGRAVVARFVEEGARVGVIDRSSDRLRQLETDFDGEVTTVEGDVTSFADNERAVAKVVETFGKLDVFVGNAGVFDYFVSLAELSAEQLVSCFDELFSVNVKGYLLGAKAALPELLRSDTASMIFTASNAAFYPAGGGPLYTASKHAVVGLVKQFAYELAPRIRVNAVAPGGTVTDLRGLHNLQQANTALAGVANIDNMIRSTNPLGLFQDPPDHAAAYVLLASTENSRAITGVVLNSDGGLGVRGFTKVAGGVDLAQ
jgi:NAD(P)-dependent dehydrogenase (short-subunit alcohol dehydrogenase family)